MGYRGTEGSRTPAAGAGASPDHGAGDDEAGYGGTGEWAADHRGAAYGGGATQSHDAAARGPARGFPPVPGHPDPVYPHDDFSAWNDSPGAASGDPAGTGGGDWDSPAADGEWDSPAASGEWDVPAMGPYADKYAGGHGDVTAAGHYAGGHWDAAPVGHWEPAGDQGEHWDQDGQWEQGEGSSAQPWGEGSGHWDAPYGRWDENGEWHGPNEPGDDDSGGNDGSGQEGEGYRGSSYDRANFAIAGRDTDQNVGQDEGRPESADYPAYGGYPGRYPGEAGGPAEAGPGRPGTPGRPSDPGRGRGAAGTGAGGSRARTIGLATAGVVVIAALAAVAYTLLSGHSGHSSAATGSSPGVSVPTLPSPTASGSLGTSGASRLGKWGYITSRATDAAPLTVAELYPAQFLITGSSYVRTTERADTTCDQALFGPQLQNAAKVYGCSQVVRASYISGGQTMMGTIGVVNLSSANDAAKAGDASGANDFVTPLNGKTGPTRNLTQGTGVVLAEYKGHYLILIWAEFANLKAPTTAAERAQLEQFASGLISGSANIALSNRMVNGHPQVTGTPG